MREEVTMYTIEPGALMIGLVGFGAIFLVGIAGTIITLFLDDEVEKDGSGK